MNERNALFLSIAGLLMIGAVSLFLYHDSLVGLIFSPKNFSALDASSAPVSAPSCFTFQALDSTENTTLWNTTQIQPVAQLADTIQLKLPSNITIQTAATPTLWPDAYGIQQFDISNSIYDGADTALSFYFLTTQAYTLNFFDKGEYNYSLPTNKWYIRSADGLYTECIPEEAGRTKDGQYPIYVAKDKNADTMLTTYLVLMRNPSLIGSYMLEFTVASYNDADLDIDDVNALKLYQKVLENMIRSVSIPAGSLKSK